MKHGLRKKIAVLALGSTCAFSGMQAEPVTAAVLLSINAGILALIGRNLIKDSAKATREVAYEFKPTLTLDGGTVSYKGRLFRSPKYFVDGVRVNNKEWISKFKDAQKDVRPGNALVKVAREYKKTK